MYSVTYESKSAILWVNKAPPNFHPIMEVFLVADTSKDIPEDVWKQLSEDQQDSLGWFFYDMEEREKNQISHTEAEDDEGTFLP